MSAQEGGVLLGRLQRLRLEPEPCLLRLKVLGLLLLGLRVLLLLAVWLLLLLVLRLVVREGRVGRDVWVLGRGVLDR